MEIIEVLIENEVNTYMALDLGQSENSPLCFCQNQCNFSPNLSILATINCVYHVQVKAWKECCYTHFAPPHFAPHTLRPHTLCPRDFAPQHFAPHSLRPILCAPTLCTPHFTPPYFAPQYFAPHTLRPTLCAPTPCAHINAAICLCGISK